MSDPVFLAIPSRFAATRLPGKPLRLISGKPLIAHVIARARMFKSAQVVVATDDERIARIAEDLGVNAVMTRINHFTGSDRLAEVAEKSGWPDSAIVVNLQGDEPLMPLSCLEAVVAALRDDPVAAAATLATPISDLRELLDPACVKVVLNRSSRALYFSRAPIPWPRDLWLKDKSALANPLPLRHVGLYAYRARTLRMFTQLEPTSLERTESLEQLRLLENELAIAVRLAPERIPQGVDTPEDLDRVAALLDCDDATRALDPVMHEDLQFGSLSDSRSRHSYDKRQPSISARLPCLKDQFDAQRALCSSQSRPCNRMVRSASTPLLSFNHAAQRRAVSPACTAGDTRRVARGSSRQTLCRQLPAGANL